MERVEIFGVVRNHVRLWLVGEDMGLHAVRLWLVVMTLVVVGCGDEGGQVVTGGPREQSVVGDPGVGDLPFGLVRCPQDPQRISAEPELYRDEPVYVANEMPVDEVRAWAASKPGFEGVWIDRSHNGWITVAFAEDAERRQAELVEEFPGVGVVAVAVDWTESELVQLRDRALAALDDAGFDATAGHAVSTGLVSVGAGELTVERLAPLKPFAGPHLCVEGVEPAEVVHQGAQPEEGGGWRLLGTGLTGPTYRTGVATNGAQYEALWSASGLEGERPVVDFEAEVVIWFGAVYGSGCEIRMDDVVFDLRRSIVHADFVIPGSPQACPDDANPKAYVVAVDRQFLPEGPFAVQLDTDDPPAGAPEERTVVDTDLRGPGAMASDDQIGIDAELVRNSNRGHVISAGDIIEPNYPALYDLDLTCGIEVIGPINGVVWESETADLSSNPPQPWLDAADETGIAEVEVLLETPPPQLSLTANGHTETYTPTANRTSLCE